MGSNFVQLITILREQCVSGYLTLMDILNKDSARININGLNTQFKKSLSLNVFNITLLNHGDMVLHFLSFNILI